MKRTLDLSMALVAVLAFSPVIALLALLIYAQDRHSPFYVGRRVGRDGRPFGMVKFRSMRILADRTGVMSTAADDPRITRVGKLLRRTKMDELPQLFNILRGDMSFVGPRPNVPSEVALYSEAERRLLSVRPGVTDFASIVFADEGDVLAGSRDPDRDYNLLIRPWKSRLGLHYIAHRSIGLDVRLIVLTALATVSRPRALAAVNRILVDTGADPELVRVSARQAPLVPARPPGVADEAWERHLSYTEAT